MYRTTHQRCKFWHCLSVCHLYLCFIYYLALFLFKVIARLPSSFLNVCACLISGRPDRASRWSEAVSDEEHWWLGQAILFWAGLTDKVRLPSTINAYLLMLNIYFDVVNLHLSLELIQSKYPLEHACIHCRCRVSYFVDVVW